MKRTKVPELMDDPNLDSLAHERALKGLESINRLSRADTMMWTPIESLARQPAISSERAEMSPCLTDSTTDFGAESSQANSSTPDTLTCLDIATGRGENPIRLWQIAKQKNLKIRFDGCDFSQRAVELAMQKAVQANCPSQFFVCNPLTDELPQTYDVTMSSLFFHHLDPAEIVLLLRKLRQCTRRMILINDLVRSTTNLWMVTLATRLLSDSPVVQFDGPASVHNAYTMEELRKMAEEAGLTGCSVTPRFPCRMLLEWRR